MYTLRTWFPIDFTLWGPLEALHPPHGSLRRTRSWKVQRQYLRVYGDHYQLQSRFDSTWTNLPKELSRDIGMVTLARRRFILYNNVFVWRDFKRTNPSEACLWAQRGTTGTNDLLLGSTSPLFEVLQHYVCCAGGPNSARVVWRKFNESDPNNPLIHRKLMKIVQ